MEVSVEDDLAVRQFLQEFNKECLVSPTEDGVQLRGSTITAYRLLPADVIPEVTDWVLHCLEQRKCPQLLADFLARHVAANVNKSLLSMGHSNGISTGDEGEILIDSQSLYSETMEHLHELCNHLRNTNEHGDMYNEAAFSRIFYPVSVSGIKNTRRKMEDRHVVIHDLNAFCGVEDDTHSSYYAIFDGHGGVEAANYSAAHLHWNIVQHPQYLTELETALKDAFKKTDEDFLCRYNRDGVKSGCTAICCIVRNNVLHVAWVGDSQAILVRQGQPQFLMEIHKPERQDERQRIEEMGGSVTYQDGWRVNNAVGVSRAIGDAEYKKWISSDADVHSVPFNGTEDFLVVACDGLWDSLSPADATAVIYHQLLQQTEDIDNIATSLVHHSKDQGSMDNISAIVVFLRSPESLAMQATDVPHLDIEVKKQNGIDHLDANGIKDFVEASGNNYSESTYFGGNTGNPFGSFSQESFATIRGSVPEKTAFSELPTPPIEDVVPSEEFSIQSQHESGIGNPFATSSPSHFEVEHKNVEWLDETASFEVNEPQEVKTTEIASDIVNTAIETALEICSESNVPKPDTPQSEQSHNDLPIIDEQETCVESMMEMINVDAFHSARGVAKENVEPNPFNVQSLDPNHEAEMQINPFMLGGNNEDHFVKEKHSIPTNEVHDQTGLSDQFCSFQETEQYELSNTHETTENAHLFSGDETDFLNLNATGPFEMQSMEPEPLKDSQKIFQENPFLSGPDSLLLYGNIPMNVETNNDLFSLTGEAPSAVRLLQGVPEMLGISESVPGSKTPEMVSVGTPSDTMEKLAATVDNLMEGMDEVTLSINSPFEVKAFDSVLETVPMLDERITMQQESRLSSTPEVAFGFHENVTIRQSSPAATPVEAKVEQFSFPQEVSKPSDEHVDKSGPDDVHPEVMSPTEPIASSDDINLEPSLPVEITNISKTVTEEVPVPAVVVESIPENVPEAEGVTEDSDSEKDGGWKYISNEKQPNSESSKTKPETAAVPVADVQPAKKDTHLTDTVKRAKPSPANATSRKPLANKTVAETKTSTIQKKPAPTPSTLKKMTPSTAKTTQPRPANPPRAAVPPSGTLKPKSAPKTTSSIRPSTAPSEATKTTNTTPTTSASSSRPGATKPSTMQRPASTVVRKAKPLATPSDAASAQTPANSSTLRTTAKKPIAQKVNTSTLPPSRVTARKPLVNGDTPASKSAGLEKKPISSSTMKPLRTLTPKTQQKETKDTVNKELSKTPEKTRPTSAMSSTRKPPVNGVKDTLPRAALTKAPIPKTQVSTIKNSGKTLLPKNNKPTTKSPQKTTPTKVSPTQNASNKVEKEKGLLEESTKETKPVDSGLASPESPLIPQLSGLEIHKEVEPTGIEQVVDPQ